LDPRRVLLLTGLPGSGKSSLARFLAAQFSLEVIDRDRIRADLFPERGYSAAEKQAANAAVFDALRAQCIAGRSSLLDGMTFSRERERWIVKSIAMQYGFACCILWLDCPVEIAVERVTDQAHPARDRSPALVREVAARFEPPEDAVRIDATLSAAEIRDIAAAALAAVT
jgi:predicted kinase